MSETTKPVTTTRQEELSNIELPFKPTQFGTDSYSFEHIVPKEHLKTITVEQGFRTSTYIDRRHQLNGQDKIQQALGNLCPGDRVRVNYYPEPAKENKNSITDIIYCVTDVTEDKILLSNDRTIEYTDGELYYYPPNRDMSQKLTRLSIYPQTFKVLDHKTDHLHQMVCRHTPPEEAVYNQEHIDILANKLKEGHQHYRFTAAHIIRDATQSISFMWSKCDPREAHIYHKYRPYNQNLRKI